MSEQVLGQKPLIANKQPTQIGGPRIGADARLKKTSRDSLADRPSISEDKLAKARANFSAQWNQSALPKFEEDPDWHYCWLSTTNSYDPIHQRMQLGYEPVRPEDIKGLATTTMTSGEFAGCINQKEMVLFRIPREIYQVAMEEMHHYEPIRQEESLKQLYDQAAGQDARGRSLGRDVGDGVTSLGESQSAPLFD